MFCKTCRKCFSVRTEYLLHATVCGKTQGSYGNQYSPLSELDDDEVTTIDDSDEDPNWLPSPVSSPVTQEQFDTAEEAESLLIQDNWWQNENPDQDRWWKDESNISKDIQSGFERTERSKINIESPTLKSSQVQKDAISTKPVKKDMDKTKINESLNLVAQKIAAWKAKRKEANKIGKTNLARRLSKKIQSVLSSNEVQREVKEEKLLESMRVESESQQTEKVKMGEKINLKNNRKKNYCAYCKSLVLKFGEHVETVHKDMPEGIALSAVKGSGKERRRLKMKITHPLRKKWNSIYNDQVRDDNTKSSKQKPLIVVKRSSKSGQTVGSIKCAHCLGIYRRDKLSVHLRTCEMFTKNTHDQTTNLKALKDHSITDTPHNEQVTEEFKKEILKGIIRDKFVETALNDTLILKFASSFHQSRRESASVSYVRRQMRDLARLFLNMKDVDSSISSFADCLSPVHFNTLTEAALKLANYNEKTGAVTTASIAYRLCQPVKDAANLLLNEEMARFHNNPSLRDRMLITQLQDFLHMMSTDWKNRIGRICVKSNKFKMADKNELMAKEKDIVTLAAHLQGKYRTLLKVLNDSETKNGAYDTLTHVLISHIMLLIRRRPVDFKNAKLFHYRNIDKHDEMIEMATSTDFTEEDKALCSKFHLFQVPGKNLAAVPMVLTPLMKTAMDCLIKYRSKVQISDDNDTLFLLSGGKHVNPVESLKLMKKEVKLDKPEHLTGNGLRHQAATFSRQKSSHPQYQDYLASTLGHSLLVHKKHYELPVGVLQKLTVLPVLHDIMTGKTSLAHSSASNNLTDDVTNNALAIEDCNQSVTVLGGDNVGYESESDSGNTEHEHKVKHTKCRWSQEEQNLALIHFSQCILHKKAPKRGDVVKFIKENQELFKNRSVAQVYMFVRNNALRRQKNVTPKINRLLKRSESLGNPCKVKKSLG